MMGLLRKIIPRWAFSMYHRALSRLAVLWYRHPSEELIVVGVTGTNGKTTTSYFIAKALEGMGKTGCATTAVMKIGDREWLNDKKMTMLGRFALQKMLREMVDAGCRIVVIETSSQGVLQFRHEEIHYDVCVLTNLTPEHLDAHGGFESYKKAKIELFRHLATHPQKVVHGRSIERTAVLNADCPHAKDFVVAGLDRVIWYGHEQEADVMPRNIQEESWKTIFDVDGAHVTLQLPGLVNVENALATFGVGRALEARVEDVAKRLSDIAGVAGRFERIEEGQPYTVLIDYAVEPVAMKKLYEVLKQIPHGRLIHVFGSCGGGRDVARRAELGKLSAHHADVAIITNEDPYDDDPEQIIREVLAGAREGGMSEDRCFAITDRGQAIEEAIRRAQPGDIVLVTGKGAEQAMVVKHNKKISWDDRTVAREAIQKMKR